MRAAVALVTAAAFLLAGCSKAVNVPANKLAPSTDWEGLYHVKTTTDQYTTRHFSVTDSTLVITKLGGSDKRYGRIDLPITVPLGDVRSVEKLETHAGKTTILVITGALLIGAIFFLSADFSGLD